MTTTAVTVWDDTDALIMQEAAPFGTDETITRVLSALASHENADATNVLYGHVTVDGASVAWSALRASGRPDVAARHFPWSGSYWMHAEDAATLFEALSDYATGASVCDATHRGEDVRGVCDCQRRGSARSWAAEVAMQTTGLQLV